ncbi:MAG: radical SAM protein [Bdellovibrionota bacterium]
MIISVFTPHGGCFERCSFCDQRVSGGKPASRRQITETIESHLKTRPRADEIAFYGGTFTALPRGLQLEYLDAVQPYIEQGLIGSVRISTRPDAIERSWVEMLLEKYKVRTIELGAQSFNPWVLKALGRSHSPEDTALATQTLKELGVTVGLHLMVGCPDEDPNEEQTTLEWLGRLKPHLIRIHPLLVLKGTGLEASWRQGRFQPLDLETATHRVACLAEAVEAQGMQIIRIGLQPNELLGESVLAGPYHPAFGELVRARVYRNQIERALVRLHPGPGDTLEISVSANRLSPVQGQKKANLTWLKSRFGLSSIQVNVLKDPHQESLNDYDFKVRVCHPGRAS